MKVEISKGWCLKMAELEGDGEIGAGLLARDPTTMPMPAELDGKASTEHPVLEWSAPADHDL